MKQDLRQHKFWQINSTSQLSSHFTPPLTFCFVLFCFVCSRQISQDKGVHMVDITYYFTSKIPNAATSIFYPRIHQSEMHDHVSAHSEKRVSICCAYTHQLHWLRWSEYICKLGLLLAESSTYPYKTTLIWNTDLFVHVCSLAFISRLPAAQTELMTQLKRCQKNPDKQTKKKKVSQKW